MAEGQIIIKSGQEQISFNFKEMDGDGGFLITHDPLFYYEKYKNDNEKFVYKFSTWLNTCINATMPKV